MFQRIRRQDGGFEAGAVEVATYLVRERDAGRPFTGVGVAFALLGLIEQNLEDLEVPPRGHRGAFAALVSQVAAPTFNSPANDERDFVEFRRVAHCLRDGRTALAGSQLSREPLGDLLLRVMYAYGRVMDTAYEARFDRIPDLALDEWVRPPDLRHFMREMVANYAAAVANEPRESWPSQEISETLSRLRWRLPRPRREMSRAPTALLVEQVYGAGYRSSDEELIDMTGDAELVAELGRAVRPDLFDLGVTKARPNRRARRVGRPYRSAPSFPKTKR